MRVPFTWLHKGGLHYPFISTYSFSENGTLRGFWKPLFDKCRVDLLLQVDEPNYVSGRSRKVVNEPTGVNKVENSVGTVYVVSVSGGKMYDIRHDAWNNYRAVMDRRAENTQLFQVIRVDGNTLHYGSYTTSGELYDAFELHKAIKKGDPNSITEKKPRSPERTFNNTKPSY